MDFGSDFVYAQDNDEEFEYVEETRYNHTTTGYSSVTADYNDDGEVSRHAFVMHQLQQSISLVNAS